jgi:hypothetical protein
VTLVGGEVVFHPDSDQLLKTRLSNRFVWDHISGKLDAQLHIANDRIALILLTGAIKRDGLHAPSEILRQIGQKCHHNFNPIKLGIANRKFDCKECDMNEDKGVNIKLMVPKCLDEGRTSIAISNLKIIKSAMITKHCP